MRILFIGDIVGRSGRDKLALELPRLKKELNIDVAIVNGENAAHGFGMTPVICKEMFDLGADVLTAGDHVWDQKDLIPYISREKRLLRPHNLPTSNAGSGVVVHSLINGKKILVIHLLAQVFHKENAACPFACADEILKQYAMPGNVQAIFVDFHGEATSEKNALGQYLDGRVSAVIGTHTHIPTADARLLSKGTAFQTDAGMCGDYNSVIGFKKEEVLQRFLTKNQKHKLEVATGKADLYAVIVETNDQTGLAKSIENIKL
jgi:metallophosphoesterase (TIGR00282 family)